MRARELLLAAAVLGAGSVGCQPPICEDVGPPYAFHVTLYYDAGQQDLAVTLTAESGDHHFSDLDPAWALGHRVKLDVEWGGAEPEGSPGTFTARRGDGEPVALSLTAEEDDEGCPLTQHRSVEWGQPW